MLGVGRPISHFNRSGKNVQLQIIKLSCVFGVVVTSTILFMNSTLSSINEENSIPQLLKLKAIKTRSNSKAFSNKAAKPRVISIQGTDSLYTDANLETIANKATVTELDLSYVHVNAQSFSESLEPFLNLKAIKLDHVNLSTAGWSFKSVYLPNLEEFYIDLTIGFHDQYTEYMKELTEENVGKLIFYNKNLQNDDTTTDLVDKLVQDRVNVTVRVDGWTVLSLKPRKTENNSFEAAIAVNFADKVLSKFRDTLNITHLTMTECIVSKSSFPTGLTYLNLYRVNVTEGDITEVLQPMTELTDLFLELRNGTLRMSDIPKSVKTLTISDINSMYNSVDTTNAERIALGFPLDPDIISNFHKIFVNVKEVGIFEPTNGTQHLLLQSVLKSTAEWVYFEGFERTNNASKTEVEAEIETFLGTLKIKPDSRQVLIMRANSTSTWRQEKLTKEQRLRFRYDMLGWDEYITWETYVENFLPKV